MDDINRNNDAFKVKKIILILTTLSLLLQVSSVHAIWPFGPKNYEECIMKNMKGVTSDMAARAIMRACREKFPDKPKTNKKSTQLPDNETQKITGTLSKGFSQYSGTIYNGSSWTVTSILIYIWAYDERGNLISERGYVVGKEIEPFKSARIYFDAPIESTNKSFQWTTSGAAGYR